MPAAAFPIRARTQKLGGVYLADSLATAVAEAIVRDCKDGYPGIMSMSRDEAVGRWKVFEISTTAPLQLLNLSGTGLMFAGISTDILRQADHTKSQQLSIAVHTHDAHFDGILYQSRFFGECICVYNRVVSKLMESGADLLSNLEGSLAPIFTQMGIQIVR